MSANEEPAGQRSHRSSEYLSNGRVNQKLRTRDSLVAVAADMIKRGVPLSVPEVADAARVSRTTAYRYFPTAEMLEAQASLFAAGSLETRHIDAIAHGSGKPEAKLLAVVEASDAMTLAHESAYRTMLRVSMADDIIQQKGHFNRPAIRRKWIEAALEEYRGLLGRGAYNRLTAALSLICGIEAVVVLKDICQLSPAEALNVKKWTAQALLETALRATAEKGEGRRATAAAKAPSAKRPGPSRSPAADNSAKGSPRARKARRP